MAEVRCPMCSKPNAEDAEVCEFCGARIKPLVLGESDAGAEGLYYEEQREPDRREHLPDQGDETSSEEVPDWLARIRAKAEDDRIEEAEADEGDRGEAVPGEAPDWLGRLRPARPMESEGGPEGEVPDWVSQGVEDFEKPGPEEAEGGWLSRLRETTAESPAEPDVGAPDEIEPTDEEAEPPEWQARAGFDAPSEPGEWTAPREGDSEAPAWQEEEPAAWGEAEPEAEPPDLEGADGQAEQPAWQAEEPPGWGEPEAEPEAPAWHEEEPAAWSEADPEAEGEAPAWQEDEPAAWGEAEPEAEPPDLEGAEWQAEGPAWEAEESPARGEPEAEGEAQAWQEEEPAAWGEAEPEAEPPDLGGAEWQAEGPAWEAEPPATFGEAEVEPQDLEGAERPADPPAPEMGDEAWESDYAAWEAEQDLAAWEQHEAEADAYIEPPSKPAFVEPTEDLPEESPSWLADVEPEDQAAEIPKAELPDWVPQPEGRQPEAEAGQALEPSAGEAEPSDWQPEGLDEAEFELPESLDWLEEQAEEYELDLPGQAQAEPEEPPAEEELPHVPALAFGDQAPQDRPDLGDFDLDAIELPDWLSEARVDEDELEAAPPSERPDLARATIPAWLEAMRPVETFDSVVDLEPKEEEQIVESVGPLAGLRGVLLAEPVVAKPRTTTSVGARLEVTERQYAQAELLQRIVEEEKQEAASPARARRSLPILRWMLGLVLLLSVLLPPLAGVASFPLPTRVSRDFQALLETVNALPGEAPVLLVFDYEPGYAAEMEAVGGALLEHLFARGMNVVTLSTQPSGPPLALDLVTQIGEPHGVEGGRDFAHLGYLSGGPSAVQLFATKPSEAVLTGFGLPQEFQAGSPWELPLLQGVENLSDFEMVAVVASGADVARIWVEQAQPQMRGRPLIMVLSAGAEPLIRPYFESAAPRVNGILTGLPEAAAYEQLNARPGGAQLRWSSFGSGALVVELALMAGLVYGLVQWATVTRRT